MNEREFVKVSVIIPTYNRAHCLERTINSVVSQDFSDLEIIIVDNYSDDNTERVVRNYSDARLRFFRFKNEGVVAASRNYGLKKARGKYVAFLDSDDWWLPKKLSTCVEALEVGRDVAYHDLYLVESERSTRSPWRIMRSRQLHQPVFNDLLLKGNTIWNSSVVVRKHFLDRVRGMSEEVNLVGCEDYDCWLRISRLTDGFVRVKGTHGCYLWGGDNLSSVDRRLMNINALKAKYEFDLENLSEGAVPAWITYGLVRCYYGQDNFEQSYLHARRALRYNMPLLMWLKTIYMLLASLVRKDNSQ